MVKSLVQIFLLASISFPAFSDVEEFTYPQLDGIRLDWCLSRGVDCGEPVAYKWCINNGYNKPIYWEKDKDIGEQIPTIMLNSQDTCYKKSCDGFRTIICYRNAG